jgi:sulfonate transport system substrate-binding protein
MKYLKVLALLLTLSITFAQNIEFNIGYQKGGLPAILKARGTLEAAKEQGIVFNWVLFTSGPPLLEALNAGAVDVGAVGDAPGVFALAGGADLKYIGVTDQLSEQAVTGSGIIVKNDSGINSVADLKGKKIALARGSSAHYFTYNALKADNLNITSDVEIVALQPPDARPALESGSVDAWAIWEPFLTIALSSGEFKTIRDYTGLPLSSSYYLTSTRVTENPDKLTALYYYLNALAETAEWANDPANQPQVVQELSADLEIPAEILEQTLPKGWPYNIRPFVAEDIAPLQQLADAFFEVGVLPTELELDDNDYYTVPELVGSVQ